MIAPNDVDRLVSEIVGNQANIDEWLEKEEISQESFRMILFNISSMTLELESEADALTTGQKSALLANLMTGITMALWLGYVLHKQYKTQTTIE